MLFVTNSGRSATEALRRLLNDEHPPRSSAAGHRPGAPAVEDRATQGVAYYRDLEKLGKDSFEHIKLDFEQYAALDALEAVVGLARVGDLEIEWPRGTIRPVTEAEVVASNHRKGRYLQHPLLRPLLSEEPIRSARPPQPTPASTSSLCDSTSWPSFLAAGDVRAGDHQGLYRDAAGHEDSPRKALGRRSRRSPNEMHRGASSTRRRTTMTSSSSAGLKAHAAGLVQRVGGPRRGQLPRILYFDAEKTRRENLWPRAMTQSGRRAATIRRPVARSSTIPSSGSTQRTDGARGPRGPGRPADLEAIEQRLRTFLNRQCIDLDALATKDVRERQAFVHAIEVYMRELAQIVAYARSRGRPAGEILDELFGDRRRRVDVTFQVGPAGEPVHVTGILDYVFYDWRTERQRVLDYKLTPADQPTNDLFQVSLYALMHHHQHHTRPDVGVLYLHPERSMIELSWERVEGHRHRVYDLLASMAAWVVYDETSKSGLKPPGEPSFCSVCPWNKDDQCVRRLGPKHEGQRLSHWTDAASKPSAASVPEPAIFADEIPDGPAPILGPITLQGPISSHGPVTLEGDYRDGWPRRDPRGCHRAGPIDRLAATDDRSTSTTGATSRADRQAAGPEDDALRIGTTVDGGIRSGSRWPPCRRTSRSSGRPAAARHRWRRSWPRRRSAGVPVLAIDPKATSSSSSARPTSPRGSPRRRRPRDALPRSRRAAGLDPRVVARPKAQPRPDPPDEPRQSSSGSSRPGARRNGRGSSPTPPVSWSPRPRSAARRLAADVPPPVAPQADPSGRRGRGRPAPDHRRGHSLPRTTGWPTPTIRQEGRAARSWPAS